jgi:rfaE bifunctional protein kinase chain/domain
MKHVLITGVFNVLHPGHIRLLRFGSECGTHLTVAIQSDEILEKPAYVSEKLRLECVLSNTYVDKSFITSESVPELIERLKPDILVKGREHEHEINPERKLLESYGGELIFASGEVFFTSLDLLRKGFLKSTGLYDFLPYDYMNRHHIDRQQLINIVKRFSELKIVVVGDLIMDEYVICEPLGMSQEDPTIVVTPMDKKLFIGGAGIVAAHASRMGAKVDFLSVSGNDKIRDRAIELLNNEGINLHLLIDNHRPTTLKQRYRAKGKTLLRVSHLHQTDISQNLQDQLVEKLEKIISSVDLLVFSDFNYGCLPNNVVNKMTEIAKNYHTYTVADSQSSSQIGDVSRYKDMDLLTPTEREARIAVRDYNSGLVVLAEQLRQNSNAKNILLKMGEEGVLIHAEGSNEVDFLTDRIHALNNNPKDVAGAGDSMLITAAMTLRVGGSIWEAALLGSVAAGLQVGRLGNKPLNIQELQEAINA